jgi:predicted nucleic acid-binding protein
MATLARLEILDPSQVLQVWQRAVQWLARAERPVDHAAALRLAMDHQISAYDAQYLILARQLGIPCVTEDRQLQRGFPDLAMSMAAFYRE